MAWDKIALARRSVAYITGVQLLPLILLGTFLESLGLAWHGKWQPRFHMFKNFTLDDAITLGVIQFILLFAVVFVSALLVFKISQTFQDRLSFLQAFTTVAYGFLPMLFLRFLDYGGSVHPAVAWLLGVLLMVWTLYQGIPRVMQPDPTHAFGVYISTVFVVTLTSGLARLLTAMYVLGYMDFQHSWLARKIANLLGHSITLP